MRITFLFLFTIYFSFAFGQEHKISGSLKTKSGNAVTYASVMVKNSDNKIISFKQTDNKGGFVIVLPGTEKLSDLKLEVNYLGFKKVNQPLSDGVNNYEILMEEQSIDLDDVQVKSRPRIISSGDTLKYNVGAFAKNEDRSIGDVLKRMPGMEVDDAGKVKFNGKAISSLYIDGDDLLDEKYAIGTRTIPHAMVQGIEVLQNHQPLKVLRNKTFSDNIAINLVIKDEAKLKLTGQAKLGAGLPEQFDSELNTILFNKKYKMLNVLNGNNIGNDLSADISGLGNPMASTLLSSGGGGSPGLPKNRYFLNRSGALNANNLVNLKSGLQLKSNVRFMLDRNEQENSSITELYSGTDTIRYSEFQDMNSNPFITNVNLSGELNKDTYFFKNNFKIGYSSETNNSSLLNQELDVRQSLQNKIREFSNALEYLPELKNKSMIRINWKFSYTSQPQNLFVVPGVNEQIFNDGVPFKSMRQYAETPTWLNQASIGYRFPKGRITQNYRVGILNELQKMNSKLRLDQFDGSESTYAKSHDNHLNWNRNEFFIDGTYEYKGGAFESTLTVPLTLQRIGYKDKSFGLDEGENRLLINPSLRVKYFTGVEDYFSLNYRYTNNVGDINGVFRGAVLSSYRSLRANDAELQERSNHNIGLDYDFRRSISMFFMNAGIQYSRSEANTIASNIVTDNISQTVLLPFVNQVNSVSVRGGLSKYIFALGATAKLNGTWSTSRSNQLFNEELLPFNNVSFSLNPAFEVRLWDRISTTYNGTGTWNTSKLVSKETSSVFPDRQVQRLEQSIGLSFTPVKMLFLNLSGRHLLAKQPPMRDIKYFFLDANARYKLNRWRTDIELTMTNLADITSYETYNLSANSFTYSRYNLRGRMMLLKFVFNL